MANLVYTKFKVQNADGAFNLGSDTLKLMLLNSGYTPNQDTDQFYSDISGSEITGTGYTAGGKALTTVVVNEDDTNHRMKLTADNVAWATASFTARYAVLYDSTVANRLIALYDFGSNQTVTGGTFTVAWDATNGVLTLT